VNDAVIFPARKGLRIDGGLEPRRLLFEAYSRDGEGPESSRLLNEIVIEGEKWFHFITDLDLKGIRDFLFMKSGYSEKHAGYLSSRLIDRLVSDATKPGIMGIVNVTPDSFYPGSRMQGKPMSGIDAILDQKPDVIDIGGESTRPGSKKLDAEAEIDRIRPVLDYVSSSSDIPVSLDTRNPETAEFALSYGIKYLNDVTGFENPEMIRIASENNLDSIVMHMRGEPENMQKLTEYGDLLFEISLFLQRRTKRMIEGGIHPSRIIVDPGIGFAKNMSGNLDIIRNVESLNRGFRVLVGASRKTFIGRITGEPVEKRLSGTLATSIYLMNGKCDIIRVHDVRENREAIDVYRAIENGLP